MAVNKKNNRYVFVDDVYFFYISKHNKTVVIDQIVYVWVMPLNLLNLQCFFSFSRAILWYKTALEYLD